MIQACIFDLDGVIVDTAKYHYSAWNRMAESLGIHFSKEENENLKGVGRMESIDYILQLGGVQKTVEEKKALAAKKNDDYLSLISKMDSSEILPGIINFLNELRKKGIKIALGSSSKNARSILEKLDLLDYFDAIIDGTKTTKTKPDPQVFSLGAEALSETPSNCVVFEDAKLGVEAAKSGGFKCIGIGEKDVLKQADFVMDGFENFSLTALAQIYK